jgi:hypothetical protein
MGLDLLFISEEDWIVEGELLELCGQHWFASLM